MYFFLIKKIFTPHPMFLYLIHCFNLVTSAKNKGEIDMFFVLP